MKVGIITFHTARNYGAYLQTYALQTYLKSLGNDVKIVNYSPKYFKKDYATFVLGNMKGLSLYRKFRRITGAFILFPAKTIRNRAFTKVLKKDFCLSGKELSNVKAVETAIKGYGFLIFGSDQIWNPKITRGFDDVFWGNFDFDGKKISYAASVGDSFELLNSDKVPALLKNFSKISVREKSLHDFLLNKYGIDSTTVIDPTLLLSKKQWFEYARKNDKEDKPYILLYILKATEKTREMAYVLSKKTGLPVKELCSGVGLKQLFNPLSGVTPSAWVRTFANATYVVTSSFHGTAFSVNLNIPFFSIHDEEENIRIKSLLELVGLMSRYIQNEDELTVENVDFTLANKKLEDLRKTSKQFIQLAMSNYGGGV